MSSQPSTSENIRSAASSATHAIAETLDPQNDGKNKTETTDLHGKTVQKGSYKDKLNEAAYSGVKGQPEEETLLQKAASYVPGLAAVTGLSTERPAAKVPDDDGTPPTRPENDVQVAEFLKSQYKSKSGENMPSVDGNK